MSQSVVIYTKNGCMQCRMTKKFLQAHHVNFEEHNINQHPEYLSYLKNQGFQSLPVVLTNNQSAIIGFRPDQLQEVIAK